MIVSNIECIIVECHESTGRIIFITADYIGWKLSRTT